MSPSVLAVLWVFSCDRRLSLTQFGITAYSNATNMNQLILPMFIMMSEFLSQGGIAEDIFACSTAVSENSRVDLLLQRRWMYYFAALCG
jgi:TRAP-type mannitol/chloroaromatic compound transport system permease large subunit